jgi:RNA polymerase sigma factor (TIGR02999 family)
MSDREQVTGVLVNVTEGRLTADSLLPLVYDELRRLAQHYLQRERPGHTRQATSIVHEVYLRLVDQTRVDWRNRAHFFAVAAMAMRRILVDHARRRARPIHGGGLARLDLEDAATVAADQPDTDLLALDRALDKLAGLEPEVAQLVEVRFFGGLGYEEAAQVLGMSERTARRRWQYAKAWLYRELSGSE